MKWIFLQGFDIATGKTLEYELESSGGDRGGADAPHRRPPPQLRHGHQRGNSLPHLHHISPSTDDLNYQCPEESPRSAS